MDTKRVVRLRLVRMNMQNDISPMALLANSLHGRIREQRRVTNIQRCEFGAVAGYSMYGYIRHVSTAGHTSLVTSVVSCLLYVHMRTPAPKLECSASTERVDSNMDKVEPSSLRPEENDKQIMAELMAQDEMLQHTVGHFMHPKFLEYLGGWPCG